MEPARARGLPGFVESLETQYYNDCRRVGQASGRFSRRSQLRIRNASSERELGIWVPGPRKSSTVLRSRIQS